MAHLQYMPGDPRLVDQLVYELKSKGIFDQFRKECIADVDTRPAYQNLRQRVENSVSTFLSRQCWKPDLNKNQLREKLRKHILDGNYLEQGVERIVDQVVNPKVASVFIPQVEDLVYNYLGISRKKSVSTAETSNGKVSSDDLLPTDLEAVSPGSVKSNDDQDDRMDTDTLEVVKMDIAEVKDSTEELIPSEILEKPKEDETQITEAIEVILNSDGTTDKSDIPLHTDDIRLENIPAPENSPPKIELESIELPKEPNISKEIPLPDQIPLPQDDGPKDQYFKPVNVNSDDDSSSDSSLRRNMSPLTPIRSYNNENSCDAQQGFDNDSDGKSDEKKTPSTFRFAIDLKSTENSSEAKSDKKTDSLAYQFNNQVNINTFNTPTYEDSSNSNNLRIDYESDANSKFTEKVTETEHNSEDSKKDKKSEDKKSSHKSSHRSRDSHRHSSGKDNRSDSKHSRDNSRHDKKSKDDNSSKSKSSQKESERSRDKSEKKDSRDSSKHSSHKSSSNKDSKSHRSSSSSQKYSSKHSDKKSSSSSKDKEKSSDKSSKERDRKDSKSSSHRSDKDRKSSSSSSKTKHEDKDKKKDKKDADDHYSLSGRGNHTRRSTDRDSNDGSSSSKGSNNQSSSKSTEVKKESKETGSKSDNTSTSGGTTSPSDKEVIMNNASDKHQQKPIRVENHLETPIASPPRLPFVPDVTLKKPKFAANLAEAKKMMRMRKFLDEEQKRMNQEAALLLEFQANVRPSLSQVYSSIPGPELEFACVTNDVNSGHVKNQVFDKEEIVETDVKNESTETNDDKNAEINDNESENAESTLRNESYNENKPFSQLVNEISERNKNHDVKTENGPDDENENKMRTEYFEVTIITEELSESDEPDTAKNKIESDNSTQDSEHIKPDDKSKHISANLKTDSKNKKQDTKTEKALDNPQEELHYFPEQEKYDAELKRQHQSNLFKSFMDRNSISNKIYLFNCDTYEENILREVSLNFGSYSIINYYRNGHLTLPKPAKNVNVNLATEIALPMDTCDIKDTSHVSSPVKSECSFELSSDYDAKLEEMVNKTSRQEVMEIILGSITDKPTIDYCTEFSVTADASLKRKLIEAESTVNNNRPVLIPKIRKLSESDLISSTTQESEEISNNNRLANSTRSKYLGRARRVGLPRPKRTNLSNSPSSDKSVENYAQNTPAPPNGKLKSTPRSKVQRYDTSDLYKPKLHYLSRRNNIS